MVVDLTVGQVAFFLARLEQSFQAVIDLFHQTLLALIEVRSSEFRVPSRDRKGAVGTTAPLRSRLGTQNFVRCSCRSNSNSAAGSRTAFSCVWSSWVTGRSFRC